MIEGAPPAELADLNRLLLEQLAQPRAPAAAPGKDLDKIPDEGQNQAQKADGAPVAEVFPAAGMFIALLGFDDGERDGAAAECCRDLVRRGLIKSARAVHAGGLLRALAACCLPDDLQAAVGCAVVLPAPRHVGAGEPPGLIEQLFHESPGRFIVCVPADRQTDARLGAIEHGVPMWPLGRTGGRELVVRASDVSDRAGGSGFKEVIRLPVATLFSAAARRNDVTL